MLNAVIVAPIISPIVPIHASAWYGFLTTVVSFIYPINVIFYSDERCTLGHVLEPSCTYVGSRRSHATKYVFHSWLYCTSVGQADPSAFVASVSVFPFAV